MFKNVVVTGSLAYDHIMSMPGRFKDHILPDKLHILNVSFIMDTFKQEFGGTAGNIAWNLGLLGIPTSVVAAAGSDFLFYGRHLSKLKSLDLTGIKEYKNELCARGFVITDKDDNQIWGFYQGAMKMTKSISAKKFLKKDTVLMIAPNDPSAMLEYVNEALEKDTPYIFDPAFNIPHFDKKNLKRAINGAYILIGNDYEIELIRQRLGWSNEKLSQNTEILITTLGSKGSRIESDARKTEIPSARPKNESDPTGAGDAFRAGLLAGIIKGYPLETSAKIGALTAVYTVEKYGTQTHHFSKSEFSKRYRINFQEILKL
ncbi:hypothetical protein A3H19_00505 [Candidatus Woesebacteria bacterium RIFCSPLOWO2_12_FULL_39_9]|nr:MAG: hypothetical protein A3H19_00505 [Candidatus Woesebacteria bacterium RIFCSPLOWO2_12_FULL_39_9]